MSNERSADKPQLNPALYDKYYDEGYAMSVRDYPRVNKYKHEFNAERHARIKIDQAHKHIEEQRNAYQHQLNKEFEAMKEPEYKKKLSEYKTKRSRKNLIKELDEKIIRGKIPKKNGGTKRIHKNKKSKSNNKK